MFLPSSIIVVVQSISCCDTMSCSTSAFLSFAISQSYSNSHPLSQCCRPIISSSVAPFSSCLQSFPTSVSFPMSRIFASGGQSIGVSASAVLPMNIQDWFPLGLTGWISLQSKGLSKSVTVSLCICHEVMGPDTMILVFWMLNFKLNFSLSSFTFIKRL